MGSTSNSVSQSVTISYYGVYGLESLNGLIGGFRFLGLAVFGVSGFWSLRHEEKQKKALYLLVYLIILVFWEAAVGIMHAVKL